MALILCLFTSFLIVHLGSSQFVKPPVDLVNTTGYLNLPVRYKEVPGGICETTPGIRSFTGYIDISTNQHIFFWLFEARHGDPKEAPLIVYIDGGPGTSSMYSLFSVMGPCGIDKNGDMYNNPWSFNNNSNLVIIDQPLTTGFSYTEVVPGYKSRRGNLIQLPDNTCPDWVPRPATCGTWTVQKDTLTSNSTKSGADTYWRSLQGFVGAFPQYSRNGIHSVTESYGGQYGSVYNAFVQKQNAMLANGSLGEPDAHHIDLRSVMIGNGWFDPIVQYAAYYNFTVFPGNTYDYRPYKLDEETTLYNAMFGKGNCRDMLIQCKKLGLAEVCADADNYCASEVEFRIDKYRDEYDIREEAYAFPYWFYPDYLNQERVQQAIGAFTNYTENSRTVTNTFAATGDDARENGAVEDLRNLIDQGVYVLEYAGDSDYICNWIGGERVAELIDAPGFDNAGYTNISTDDGVVHGQVKQSANFAFARIYEAGHSVPFYQPLVALQMLERVIAATDIATGKKSIGIGSEYKSIGTARSEYRNGNSTMVFHTLGRNATYNITTNRPNPPGVVPAQLSGRHAQLLSRRRLAGLEEVPVYKYS